MSIGTPFNQRNNRVCRARRHDGEKCKRLALKGRDYCKFHGGRAWAHNARYMGAMPRFYNNVLGKTLTRTLEEFTGCSAAEQLQLYEELALIRDLASTSVEMYSLARDSNKIDSIRLAGEVMRDHLREVISTCEAAARIENAARDKVSVQALHMFVSQIVKCAYDAFDHIVERAAMEDFDSRIAKIRLPQLGGAEGTTVTPDQDAIEMDATVPSNGDTRR